MQKMHTQKSNNRYYIQFLFLFLSITAFFKCIFITDKVSKVIYYTVILLLIGASIQIRRRGYANLYRGFDRGYALIFIGFCSSTLVATFIEKQPFLISCIVMIPYFMYFLYYLFRQYRIHAEVIEKVILSVALIYTLVFTLNNITYPIAFFGEAALDESRGGIRFRVPGISYVVFAMLYFINKYILNRKSIYLIYSIACYGFVCLTLNRQTILLAFVLGILFLFQKISMLRKTLFVLFVLPVLYFTIPKIPLVQNLITTTQNQTEYNESRGREGIRMQAYRHFLIDGQQDVNRFIFGHGKASYDNSAFGDRARTFAESNNIYQVDVGIAGFLYDFGIIAWIGIISLLIKAIVIKKNSSYSYITYFFMYMILTSFASYSIISVDSIALISAALYIISCDITHRSANKHKLTN